MAFFPGATLDDQSLTGGGDSPNVSPAGSSPQLKQPATTWPAPGIIRELNSMWLHPGLLDILGTGNEAESSALKVLNPPPAPIFPSPPSFNMPDYNIQFPPAPEFGGVDLGGGLQDGGGVRGASTPPSLTMPKGSIPDILRLVGLADNVLKNMGGDPNTGFSGDTSSNLPNLPNLSTDKPQVGPNDIPEFEGTGLLNEMLAGDITPSALVDQYGNIKWDMLGINASTNPQAITDYFTQHGIDVNQPGWLDAQYGLSGPTVDPNQFNLGTSPISPTDESTAWGLQGAGNSLSSLSSLLGLIPDSNPQAKAALAAAQSAQSLYSAGSDLAAGGSLGSFSTGVGAAAGAASLANSLAGGPKNLGYGLSDIGLLASSFGPQAFVTVPMLLDNIGRQIGVFGNNPSVKYPKGFLPVPGGQEGVNPLTGNVFQSEGDGRLQGLPDRATAEDFINWNIPSPIYAASMPSVADLLQGLPQFRPGTPDPENRGSYIGNTPTDYSSFNTPYPGDMFSAGPGLPTDLNLGTTVGGDNPYREALNYLYQQIFGTGTPVDQSGYQTYAPVLAQQGPEQVAQDLIASPQFQQEYSAPGADLMQAAKAIAVAYPDLYPTVNSNIPLVDPMTGLSNYRNDK